MPRHRELRRRREGNRGVTLRPSHLAVWIGLASGALILGTGIWSIVATFTTMSNTLTYLSTRVGELEKAKAPATDLTTLSTKVGEIDKELDQAKTKIGDSTLRISTLRAQLTEIETQFCAEDIVRNQAHESNQRLQAAMFEKLFGQRLGTDNAYYPVKCNRQSQGGYGGRAQ